MLNLVNRNKIILPIFIILIISLVIQSILYLNQDVSWHMLMTFRFLQGGNYANDFMDISPPIIIISIKNIGIERRLNILYVLEPFLNVLI